MFVLLGLHILYFVLYNNDRKELTYIKVCLLLLYLPYLLNYVVCDFVLRISIAHH